MFFQFSDINDRALVLANILRNFDPETMAWLPKSPVLFPNYDQDGFKPAKTIRKPFGVQRILECIAKDCGFNSYKAMLNEHDSPNKTNKNKIYFSSLKSLNPYPKNEYYTQYWNAFIETICFDAFNGTSNPKRYTPISYLVYRNFKQPELSKYAPYMQYYWNYGGGMASICDYNIFYGKKLKLGDIKGRFSSTLSLPISNYYPIAESILFTLLEMDLDSTIKSELMPLPDEESDIAKQIRKRYPPEYTYSAKDIPFKSFLVHEEWADDQFNVFSKNLTAAMDKFFNVDFRIYGKNKNPLEKMVSIDIPYDIRIALSKAKTIYDLHIRLRKLALKLSESLKDDTGYYTHIEINPTTVLHAKEHQEIAAFIRNSMFDTNEINQLQPYGTKGTWINRCLNFYNLYRIDELSEMDEDSLTSFITNSILEKLQPYNPPQIQPQKRKYKYDFTIANYEQFIPTEDIFLPKTIRVYSEFELNHYFAEMAVQAQLIKLIPSSLKMDSFSKRKGIPTTLKFDLTIYGEECDDAVNFKRVGNLKKPDMVIDFDFNDIVYSIAFIPFEEDELEEYGFDHSNFERPSAPNDDELSQFMNYFPTQLGLKCFKIDLCFIDTVYQDPLNFELGSEGWNTITAYTSYHADHNHLSFTHLSYDFSDHHVKRSKINRQITETMDELGELPQFKAFFAKALKITASNFIKLQNRFPDKEILFSHTAIYHPNDQ